jgi:Ca2+-binding EF-hand superfamily protein
MASLALLELLLNERAKAAAAAATPAARGRRARAPESGANPNRVHFAEVVHALTGRTGAAARRALFDERERALRAEGAREGAAAPAAAAAAPTGLAAALAAVRRAHAVGARGDAPPPPAGLAAWRGARDALHLTDSLPQAEALFRSLDADGSGLVDRAELAGALAEAGLFLSAEAVDSMLRAADADGDGRISLAEWAHLCARVGAHAEDARDAPLAYGLAEWRRARDALHLTNSLPQAEALFRALDADGSGKLDAAEIAEALNKSGVPLSAPALGAMMQAADADGDGRVSLAEWVHLCARVGVCAAGGGAEAAAPPAPAAPAPPPAPPADGFAEWRRARDALHLTDSLAQTKAVFRALDSDGSGLLDRAELAAALTKAGVAASAEAVDAMISAADENGDGRVSLAEFQHLCALVGAHAAGGDALPPPDGLAAWRSARDALHLTDSLQQMGDLFRALDADGSGLVDRAELAAALAKAGLFLSAEAVDAMLRAADADGDGRISLAEWQRVCAHVGTHVAGGAHSVAVAYGLDEWVLARDALRLTSSLKRAEALFRALDADGSGLLDRAELTAALAKAGLRLSPYAIDAMISAADTDGDGRVSLAEWRLLCAKVGARAAAGAAAAKVGARAAAGAAAAGAAAAPRARAAPQAALSPRAAELLAAHGVRVHAHAGSPLGQSGSPRSDSRAAAPGSARAASAAPRPWH